MRRLVASLLFLASLPVPALRAQQSTAVTSVLISVTEPTGMGVAGARIRVVPAPDHAPTRMETDDKGRLALELKPAGYALFVNCPGFASVATYIEVSESGATQSIPVALHIASPSPPVVVVPSSEKESLLISAYPYHEDVRVKPAEIKAIPHTTLTVRNPHTNADETYSGVRLDELLARMGAPLGKELHGIALVSYLIATGSDGYEVIFSLAEADPAFHPGTIIVADSINGRPLDAESGPYKLVVSEDKRPARWVRNLVSLELKTIN